MKMWRLVFLEFQKFSSKKYHWAIVVIFSLVLMGFINSKMAEQKGYSETILPQISMEEDYIHMNISQLNEQLSESPEDQALTKRINDLKQDINYHSSMRYAMLANDWSLYLENKVAYDESLLIRLRSGEVEERYSESVLEEAIMINSILLDQQITPIDTQISIEGYNYLILFANSGLILLIIFIVIFFTSTFIPSDFEEGTYKLLLTQPLSKMKIMMSKIISALLLNYVWIFTTIGVSFYGVSNKYGMGDKRYPIKFYQNRLETYIEVGTFVKYILLLLFLLITITVILTICISIFIRHSTTTLAITAFVILGAKFFSIKKFAHLNPFTYLEIIGSLRGNVAISIENSRVSFDHAIWMIPITSLILIIVNLISYERLKLKR